jgi:hypothetical protein
MNDDLIIIEPRQEAVLRYDDVAVHCRNVPEAWLAWAQLEINQKVGATIEVADAIYNARAIRRLRYQQDAEAA